MGTQSILFLYEAFDIISCTTILGVVNGLAFSLYCLCASSLYLKLRNPDKRRRTKFLLGYISILFFCTTVRLALNAQIIRLAYINHADFPGGPFAYEASHGSDVLNLYRTTGIILDFIIEVLTMGIQIWRLWIIWSATEYAVVVTILPVLLLLVYIALEIPGGIVYDVVSLGIPVRSLIEMGTATFAALSTLTTLVTGLIAARLFFARRRFTKAIGASDTMSASPYVSIVTILVESYALESAWSLAAAILYAVDNPSFILFIENDSNIKIITYFLIVYRVEKGRGWTKQTQEKLTSLRFDRGAQSTTDNFGSQAPATTTMSGIGSSTIGHSDSSA